MTESPGGQTVVYLEYCIALKFCWFCGID